MKQSSEKGEPNGPQDSTSPGARAVATTRAPLPGVAFRPEPGAAGKWLNGWRVADETQCVCR